MNRLRYITNPFSLLLLTGTFVYYYFVYDPNPPVQKKKDLVEVEAEIVQPVTPQNKTNAAANVAGIVMKEENAFNTGVWTGRRHRHSSSHLCSWITGPSPAPDTAFGV